MFFPEVRDVGHHDSLSNEIAPPDSCRVEYPNDVSDESGSPWQVLEKSASHSSRPEGASQSPVSALADFGYAESAVRISKKASLVVMKQIRYM